MLVIKQLGDQQYSREAARCLAEFLKTDYKCNPDVLAVGYAYGSTKEQPCGAPDCVNLYRHANYTFVEQAYGPYSSTFRVYCIGSVEYYEFVMYGIAAV